MKQKILILFSLLFITSISKAQDTEFWFAASHPSEALDAGNRANRPVLIAISNDNRFPADVTITLYNDGTPVVFNETIPADGFFIKEFITAAEVAQFQNPRSRAGTVTKYGIHITSRLNVSVYYQANCPSNRDIYILKGKKALGSKFYVPMQHDEHSPNQTSYTGACDQIDIVAIEDNTVVTIVPTKVIRVGASGSAPANVPYVMTLNKGETLKIMEHVAVGTGGLAGSRSLAGTRITTQDDQHPVAVSVTEDYVNGDLSGDQLVPVENVSREYILVRGSSLASDYQHERTYFVGTVDGTVITIFDGVTNPTYTVNEGESVVYAFNMTTPTPGAVFASASQPVYCYQRTGHGEQGSSLLPSIYAIANNKVSFYQTGTGAPYQKAIAVFRTGSENDFNITYSGNTHPITVSPIAIPGISGWMCARFDLPNAANNRVVSISNLSSPIQIGYIFSNHVVLGGNTGTGIFSNYGTFDFGVDIIYKCPDDAHTLFAGYGDSYKWEYSTTKSGPYTTLSGETGHSLAVTDEGYYRLEMIQNAQTVSDTVHIRNLNLQPTISHNTVGNATTFSATLDPILTSDPNLEISYFYWEFDNGIPSTSSDATPTVTWTGETLTARLTITGESNSANSTGSCSMTFHVYLMDEQDACMGKAEPIDASSFTLPDGSIPTSYQWQNSKDGATWANITENGTGSSYAISPQKRGVTYYRVLMDGTASEPTKVRLRSCQLPVNHNISVMGYYD